MTPLLRLSDSLGERSIERADLPLAIGGAGCAVALAGAPAGPVAWLGLHDDALFLQPVAPGQVLHNGAPAESSTWLHAGDVITVGSAVLRLRNVDGVRTLSVEDGGTGNITAPPVIERGDVISGTTAGGFDTVVATQYQASQSRSHASLPRDRRTLLYGGLALAVVLILWFLASGVAVQVRVSPPGAQLHVSGGWLTPRFGSTLFLRPGRYTLSARAPGYAQRTLGFVVTGQPGQVLVLQLMKLPGTLDVELAAPGTMRVDAGADTFKVPGPIQLPAGRHQLLIESPGFLPYNGEVTIAGAGSRTRLSPRLQPNAAGVSISSEPTGAQLLVDGKAIGVTPLTQTLPAGSHHIELRSAGFKPWSTDVLVKPGAAQSIGPVRMGLPDALLAVRSDPTGARVTIGGVYRGETPLRVTLRPEIELALAVALPGYEEASRTINTRPGTNDEISFTLKPIIGKVAVRVTPADAELWVDGTRRGQGSQVLELTAVAHQLEVRKSGYATFSASVTPRPGFDQAVEATLLTEAQQHMARFAPVVRAHGSIELRLMPIGRYTMGSSRREPGRRANEGQRTVELRRPFYLSTREISNAEFHEFKPEHKSGIFSGVSLNLDNQPVANVSWQDAAAYCNWLSQRDGLPPAYKPEGGELVAVSPMNTGYRLPSEAEWEWAARGAAAAHRYPWGDALPVAPNSGNYADASAHVPLPDVITGYDDGFLAAAPVGSFAPSALGLYDLGGNVSEWTTDLYASSYSAEGVASDPMNLAAGNQHAVRGASWRSASSADLRVAARAADAAPRDDLGFRIARYAE